MVFLTFSSTFSFHYNINPRYFVWYFTTRLLLLQSRCVPKDPLCRSSQGVYRLRTNCLGQSDRPPVNNSLCTIHRTGIQVLPSDNDGHIDYRLWSQSKRRDIRYRTLVLRCLQDIAIKQCEKLILILMHSRQYFVLCLVACPVAKGFHLLYLYTLWLKPHHPLFVPLFQKPFNKKCPQQREKDSSLWSSPVRQLLRFVAATLH